MQKHPFLSSAAFISTLLATTSLGGLPAYAQKGSMLAPVTQWAITKVDGTADQDGYCALARRFRANTILTIARNPGAETSVALDFQAPKMDAGQNIKIVLDPGAGEQRSYYITPVSAEAFVVRLGRDEKFFNALQTTGFLRIEAAGESYNFNLADIDQGQAKIASCVSALDGTPVMKQASSDDSGSGVSRSEIEKLRADIQSLKQDNQRLAGIVSKDNPDDGSISPIDFIKEKLTGHADRLETQNRKLRDRIGSSGVSAGQPYGDDISLSHLEKENSKLRRALRGISLPGDEGQDLKQKVSYLEQENTKLRDRIDQVAEPAELHALKTENRRLQSMIEDRSGDIELAQNEVQDLKAENEQLKTDLEAVKEAPPVPVSEPPPISPGDDLQKKLQDLTETLHMKEKRLVELSDIATEAEELRKKNAELEKKLQEQTGGNPDVAALNARIKQLEEENNRLIQQMQSGGGENAEKTAALTKENEDLKKQIEDLKAGKDNGGDAMKAELDRLHAENEDLKKQLAELKANPPATPEPSASNDEIIALRKENDELKAKLEQMNAAVAEAAGVEKQLEEQKKKTESLESDLKAEREKPAQVAQAPSCDPAEEIAKVRREADVKKQKEMQSLARENIGLKERLAKYIGPESAPAPQEPPQQTEPMPVQQVDKIIEPKTLPAQPMADDGMTAAQRQEMLLRNSLKEEGANQAMAMKQSSQNNRQAGSAHKQAKEQIAWNWQDESKSGKSSPVKAAPAPQAIGSSFSLQDALAKANIVTAGQVQKVEKASTADKYAWQWRAGAIYGSAEQKPLRDPSQFENEIKTYLEKTQRRCSGDFAVAPDESVQAGGARMDSYEIACVGKTVNSSASLLFVDKGGAFTVVAHEASADKMNEAMNLRDRLMKTIGGS